MSQSFDQWMNEIEVFSTRRERAFDDLGPNYEKWLLAAWMGGMKRADPEFTDDGTKKLSRISNTRKLR